jgi:predicted O-linked N-acetylglucosamine transferase (SPINDLY family)
VAIAFGLDDSPELRREIKSAFEDFIDMREWNDADIAAWIRRREIDIVIDLTGLTQHNVRTIPKSVLWLSKPNSEAKLGKEARGVSRERIIFATRLAEMSDHLARQCQTDLFLNTLPYNARATRVGQDCAF